MINISLFSQFSSWALHKWSKFKSVNLWICWKHRQLWFWSHLQVIAENILQISFILRLILSSIYSQIRISKIHFLYNSKIRISALEKMIEFKDWNFNIRILFYDFQDSVLQDLSDSVYEFYIWMACSCLYYFGKKYCIGDVCRSSPT